MITQIMFSQINQLVVSFTRVNFLFPCRTRARIRTRPLQHTFDQLILVDLFSPYDDTYFLLSRPFIRMEMFFFVCSQFPECTMLFSTDQQVN